MASAGIGQKSFTPKPPDKGSFPLDHDGDCRDIVNVYLKCLTENQLNSSKCRDLAKSYLQCRMDKNLMEKENMENLGFKEKNSVS